MKSPRSTAQTDSFKFASYDADDNVLDFQNLGLVARAEEYHEIQTVSFESSSQVVGALNVFLEVTFTTQDQLIESDELWVAIPKWN